MHKAARSRTLWAKRAPLWALAAMVGTAFGCGTGQNLASNIAKPPEFPTGSQTKCSVTKSQARPLIVEWPAPDRAALESQASRGLVVVRYSGCELEVLRQCRAPGNYSYTSLTPKQEQVTIRDADELYANIPVHAVKFEGVLQKSGQLNVSMTIVGMYESQGAAIAPDKLEGECKGATHVVTALTVGAFEFFAGAEGSVSGAAGVMGMGAGAKSTSQKETLSRDGKSQSCEQSKRGDAQPPDGCGAFLRLEVAALGTGLPSGAVAAKTEPVAPKSCPSGTKLEGTECKPIQAASAPPTQPPAVPGGKLVRLAPEDEGYVDPKGGSEWGNRCVVHMRANRLDNARAACQKGLDSNPDGNTRGAILYNMALIEQKDGDTAAACQYLRQSLSARPDNYATRNKYQQLCEQASVPQPSAKPQ